MDLSEELKALGIALRHKPNPNLILWAGMILDGHPREDVPDWVEALANGNAEAWNSVCEVALADLEAQEADDAAE